MSNHVTTIARVGKKNKGGRPPKFEGPSRPVTMTLPEKTLQRLRQIDQDHARAIVRLAELSPEIQGFASPLVEVVEMVSKTGLIVIGHSQALRRIRFLHLVEVSPGRFLLALDPGNDFKNLEIAVSDLLDDVPEADGRERDLLLQLLEQIRKLRQSDRVRMAEILFVKLDGRTQARTGAN